ncbi:MAG: endolytic transglycosylase MltG [Armatimonadota bacterium]
MAFKKRRQVYRSPAIVVIGFVILAVVFSVYIAFTPVGEGASKLVAVGQGATAQRVATRLKSRGVIRSEIAFQVVVRWQKQAAKLQPGTYEVSPAMTLVDIANMIASGQTASGMVTIPEGFTVKQIAARLEKAKVCTEQQFIAFCTTGGKSLSAPYKLPANLEGYLFPDTYRLPVGMGARAAAQEMVSATTRQLYTPNKKAINSQKLSFHELLTVASLVEREAKVAVDRPMISGVIRNRMAKGMRLQIDATVLYAKQQHQAIVYRKDLWVESPYNTYRNAGLPPGPIASPGASSFVAALKPANTNALYYVAKPDGSHVFTDTYEEHLAAVKRVRRR